MKKVSILSLHLGYGGVEKSIVSLANLLCNRYEVEIATCYKLYPKSVFELDEKVRVVYLNSETIVPNREKFKKALHSFNIVKTIKEGLFACKVLYLKRKKMIQYIKQCDSDVIISTKDIFNQWLGLYGKENTIKIGWEHNHFHDNVRYADNIVNSVDNLDYLVLVSSDLQKYYSKRLNNKKCMCIHIPNCIDKVPEKASPLKEKRLISVGRLSPEKGYLDLLKVFNLLHSKEPNWRLDIIGDGSDRAAMEEFIKNNHLENYVCLHGFQNKDYIDDLMQKSSIYLMASHTESFGIVLIEAMSHGIPCIAFDSAEGAREIINSGDNGYLIKNRNYKIMVKKIIDLINNKSERIRLGKNARKSVSKFTSEAVGEEWFTLIEESDVYE